MSDAFRRSWTTFLVILDECMKEFEESSSKRPLCRFQKGLQGLKRTYAPSPALKSRHRPPAIHPSGGCPNQHPALPCLPAQPGMRADLAAMPRDFPLGFHPSRIIQAPFRSSFSCRLRTSNRPVASDQRQTHKGFHLYPYNAAHSVCDFRYRSRLMHRHQTGLFRGAAPGVL